jgi:hypothetical protein
MHNHSCQYCIQACEIRFDRAKCEAACEAVPNLEADKALDISDFVVGTCTVSAACCPYAFEDRFAGRRVFFRRGCTFVCGEPFQAPKASSDSS